MDVTTLHFLRLMDLTTEQLTSLLQLAHHLKQTRKKANHIHYLTGKNIALIFEKESTRTRCACEVAAYELAAHVTYLNPQMSQIGHKESIADTARVLSRFYDLIIYRGDGQSRIESFANHASIPICNGLTHQFHPTQMVADLMTLQEANHFKALSQLKLAYLGDAKNNISQSLIEVAALTGLQLNLVAPQKYWPEPFLLQSCQAKSHYSNNITCTDNIAEGVHQCDFLYTDVWCSMGESQQYWKQRIHDLIPYQINQNLLDLTGNPKVKLLHCLPALHDATTTLGAQLAKQYGLHNGIEITHSVFESDSSLVFEQAENRLHSLKAIMLMLLLPDWQQIIQ